MLVLPPELYVEWVRFMEPHLPPSLRHSPTHAVCVQYTLPQISISGTHNQNTPMRRAYVWRLIREYPDQYAAFTALMRMTGKWPK